MKGRPRMPLVSDLGIFFSQEWPENIFKVKFSIFINCVSQAKRSIDGI
jgi:hypothetical protein